MNQPDNKEEKMNKAIALRITDEKMYNRIKVLAKSQGLSLNMTVNMLLGYAFNQQEVSGKKFVATVVFESVDKDQS